MPDNLRPVWVGESLGADSHALAPGPYACAIVGGSVVDTASLIAAAQAIGGKHAPPIRSVSAWLLEAYRIATMVSLTASGGSEPVRLMVRRYSAIPPELRENAPALLLRPSGEIVPTIGGRKASRAKIDAAPLMRLAANGSLRLLIANSERGLPSDTTAPDCPF